MKLILPITVIVLASVLIAPVTGNVNINKPLASSSAWEPYPNTMTEDQKYFARNF